MKRFIWLTQRQFYNMAGVAALSGLFIGSVTALFWAVIYAGINFFREVVPDVLNIHHGTQWYIILLILGGSVLVGLAQKFFGDYPKALKDEMDEFREHKRFESDHIPQGMLTSLASLSAGASLGPEAALLGLSGGLSTRATDRIKQMSTDNLWTKQVQYTLLVIALLAGGFGFFQVASRTGILAIMGMFDASLYQFEAWHLMWTIPATLIGVGAGYLFLFIDERLKQWMNNLPQMPIRKAVSGGILFAVIATLFPLTLYSGQESLIELQTHGQELSVIVLLGAGLLKLFSVSLLLNTGWKGGTFLPLMASASILGLLPILLNPDLPTLAPMVASMSGIVVVSFGNPIIALVVMAIMTPVSTAGIYILAILLTIICMRLLSIPQSRRSAVAQEV